MTYGTFMVTCGVVIGVGCIIEMWIVWRIDHRDKNTKKNAGMGDSSIPELCEKPSKGIVENSPAPHVLLEIRELK